MKKFSLFPILLFVCMATSLGAWDYVISSGYHGTYTLTGTQSLLMTGGGTIGIRAEDLSYVEIRNTSPLEDFTGGIYTLDLVDESNMNFYGGDIGNLTIWEQAHAIFRGGRIDYIGSYQYVIGDPHIEIICRDYTATSALVTGTWNADNNHNGLWDTFSIQLLNQSGYSPVLSNIKFTVIPEPATLMLLAFGALLIRKKK